MMSSYRMRVKAFEDTLSQNLIDIKTLRKLCFNEISFFQQAAEYPCKAVVTSGGRKRLHRRVTHSTLSSANVQRRGLGVTKVSLFFLKRRLCPEISFFQQAAEYPCKAVVTSGGRKRLHRRVTHSTLSSANVQRRGLGVTKIALVVRKAAEDYAPLEEGREAHWEVVERLLFLYAKMNPGQGYVQGMNEIIGPIYYTFATDPVLENREHAEADCFFVFTNLMGEIRDFFIKSLDETESGINRLMSKLNQTMKQKDLEVWEKLYAIELHPQYYSFRWLTLLLSQEFPLPDVLRIWDSLFADELRFSFLNHICCAMILLVREDILAGDFPSIVKLLQHYPSSVDIPTVISKAVELAGRDVHGSLLHR
ncbi:TBC1 domain family member 13 [Diaphorina citri]|uniref:TBC1 domain family member 13 n=1 Tax=Diaphorina citri TaxID=121845 RepID=A0A1S4EDR3_DIACI|nr:TBC1 domain family member 13 [Diaphorina citri]